MSLQELFSRLNRQGIRLELKENNLEIKAPKGKLTPALVKQLREKKQEIITFLQSHARDREKYFAVEAVEKKEYYPLSSAQKRLYIIQQMDLDVIAYNMPLFLELSGEFDRDKFTVAFRRLIVRHESLRTSFHIVEDEPVQRIEEEVEFKFTIEDYEGTRGLAPLPIEPAARSPQPAADIISSFIRPFDLTRAPLLRVGLIKIGKHRHILMVDTHHIVADGVSRGVFIKDFMSLYQGEELPRLPIQYKDFTGWQNREKHKDGMKSQEGYWLKEFNDEIPVLNLPVDFVRPPEKCFAGSTVDFELNPGETKKLKKLAREEDSTLFMVLLAIYNIFLSKVSGQEDIVIGTPVSGRGHSNLQRLTGMFVNTLALRNAPNGAKSFKEFLEQLSERTLEAFENRDYQFEDLVEQITVQRDANRNPLFDIMLALENMETAEIKISGLKLKPYNYHNGNAKFDLMLTAVEAGENLQFTFEYCSGLFIEETVLRFTGFFHKIISTVLENRDIRISGIEIINEEEKNRILLDFNKTASEYPRNKTISQLFLEQVERTPDSVALAGAHELHEKKANESQLQITYTELNEKTDQVAHWLREKGVQPDIIVGIMVERSIEMIIGILGILKSGGAYLPIDVDYPEEQIFYMLVDSSTNILLTTPNLSEKFEKLSITKCQLLMVNENPPVRRRLNTPPKEANLINNYQLIINNLRLEQAHMAYIIYTSGSTGKPKGVLVEHRNAANTVNWFVDIHKVGKDTRILQLSDYTFDASVNQIFGTLISGASLYIAPKEIRSDIEKLRYYIIYHRINIINFVPTFLKELLCYVDKLESLHTVISGAEKLDEIAKESIIGKGYRLVNQYGPTETAIDALVLECSSERVSLGKPISNVRVYILDKYENVLPIGVVGELYITGAGVTRGYLNRPGLTTEKFKRAVINHSSLVNSTSKLLPNDQCPMTNDRLYKTGDLARWLPDGNIQFLGRMDFQVKIRGFRIELGEIENQLLTHGKIKQAIVLPREDNNKDNNDKYLCAYIVAEREEINKLREYLSQYLPDYMVPSYFVQLDGIPLTHNGKVDRKSLPAPMIETGAGYEAPRDDIEKKLVEIWSGVLGIETEKIGIYDNFFHLGGHSLKATVLVLRIHREFNVTIPLNEIFRTSNIRGLALHIREAAKEEYIAIEVVEKKEYYPLSSAQRRLYILQQMDAEKRIAYNMPSVWQLQGELDVGKMERVFQQLIQRHESLRTLFTVVNDEPVQRIEEEVEVKVEVREEQYSRLEGTRGLAPLPEEPATRNPQPATAPISSFIRPFDLSHAPLLRVELINMENKKHILMVDMHHIISDGLSIGIFIEDFIDLYAEKSLRELKLHYKDYSEWNNRCAGREYINHQGTYWLQQFKGEVPVLGLPTDYPRPAVQSLAGGNIHFEINKEETAALKSLALEQEVTLFMLLLSLYTVFLCKLSGQEDIVVGTPVAGRRHVDLEPIMGMFVNTLALRNFPVMEKTFGQFLKEIKENTINSFDNQGYLYEDLVEQVELERDTGRNPLFDTMFVLQNMDTPGIRIPGLKIAAYPFENRTSKFDMTLTAVEGDRLAFTFEYCSNLFKKETIQRFTGFFKKTVSTVLERHGTRLSGIEIITPEEKNRVLLDFNDTGAEYPCDKTIHQLFAEQMERTPDNIALHGCMIAWMYGEEGSITYKELNKTSNRLVHFLKEKGIQTDTIVGIKVERSTEMIIGILGILKSGGAYLPIDPDYPEERIDFMLKDSNAAFLLTAHELSDICRGTACCAPTTTPAAHNLHLSLAYIIYTSGSTGHPKGVMVNHGSIVNLLFALHSRYPLTKRDTYLLKTSYLFDVSVSELFGWFLEDGRLTVLEPGGEKDPGIILDTIERSGVTHINFVPSMFQVFTRALEHENNGKLSSLKYIFLAGEALLPRVVQQFRLLNTGIVPENIYGPTEAAVYSSWYSLAEWQPGTDVPIGKPLPNVKLYILDQNEHMKPIGIAGELCIGGAGLSRGYLNKPGLTKEKFLHLTLNTKHLTLYKTGDLARWLSDGNIEFLGRIDHQVKIRGFRIELGEIENQLLTHEKIKEAIVIAREDNNDKFLCAYIISKSIETKPIDQLELRDYLSHRLPDYMVPAYFVQLDGIPLTQNGKVDRKALPAPMIETGAGYEAPGDDIEKKLVEIWSGVLGIETENIGIYDIFFHLGGHSLKATLLIARIHKEINVMVPLKEVFKRPTIRGLAAYIKQSAATQFTAIKAVEEKQYYAVSSVQKRLYFLQTLEPQNMSYNIVDTVLIEGELDIHRVKQDFKKIIQRHDSLRTSFFLVNGEPFQRVHQDIDFHLPLTEAGDNQVNEMFEHFLAPFDLEQVPLLRVQLVKTGSRKHYLMMDMHHIISDGTSLAIFITDFMALYEGRQLPALSLQYKDYSEWQNSQEQKEAIIKQEAFWLKHFEGEIPLLNLPTTYARPPEKNFKGSTYSMKLDTDNLDTIKRIAAQGKATPFMVLLAVFNILLYKLSGQEDIVVGTSTAGRRHVDLNHIIGMFVNAVALRNFPRGSRTFPEFLADVKERTLSAFENQDYLFENLVEQLNIKREHGRSPVFDVMFVMNNEDIPEINITGLTLKPLSYDSNTSQFDLKFRAIEAPQHLLLVMEYSTQLFTRDVIKGYMENFQEILATLGENIDVTLENIPISHGLVSSKSNTLKNDQGDFEF
ncbi:MAG: amino acid adenylation domain-containing protein [Candidatus Aminicenantes bacterium]|jgi:amino acid adenylation domain-containing protein